MVHVGVALEGKPDTPHAKLDDGFVVPSVSLSEIYRDHQRQIHNQVELAAVADDVGFEYVLHPELHFSLLGANSPTPGFVQTAVAERTDDLRMLRTTILPWHDPVRLAEQTATLDVLSDGRAEVMLGLGGRGHSLAAETFGQYWGGTLTDRTKNYVSFVEKLEILVEAWTQDFLSHHGQFHDVPPSYTEWSHDAEYHYLAGNDSEYGPEDYMNTTAGTTTAKSLVVSPRPEQDPHPQLWRSVESPRSIEWAARRGVNLLTVVQDFVDTANLVELYHEAAEDAGWPDHRPEYDGEPLRRGWDERRRRGIVGGFSLFNTEVADEETFERWKLGKEFALSSKRSVRPPAQADQIAADAEELLADGDAPIVGDTDEIIDQLARFNDVCGYEDFALFLTIDVPGVTRDEIETQLRAFAEDVVPYFEEQSSAES